MLTLNRYPGQSIIFEYGNTLELLYRKVRKGPDLYTFQIFVNNILKKTYTFERDTLIVFEDDNITFRFRIEPKKHWAGINDRKITMWCPDFVKIRRKEVAPI